MPPRPIDLQATTSHVGRCSSAMDARPTRCCFDLPWIQLFSNEQQPCMCSTTKFCLCTLIGVDRGRVPSVTWIRQGRQDPRPVGVALFWNTKYLDAEDPCTTTATAVYHYFHYRRHVRLRNVDDYRRRDRKYHDNPEGIQIRQVHLRNEYHYFPRRPVNNYFLYTALNSFRFETHASKV